MGSKLSNQIVYSEFTHTVQVNHEEMEDEGMLFHMYGWAQHCVSCTQYNVQHVL